MTKYGVSHRSSQPSSSGRSIARSGHEGITGDVRTVRDQRRYLSGPGVQDGGSVEAPVAGRAGWSHVHGGYRSQPPPSADDTAHGGAALSEGLGFGAVALRSILRQLASSWAAKRSR